MVVQHPLGHLQTAEDRHALVEHQHVGADLRVALERLGAVARLAGDVYVGLEVEHRAQEQAQRSEEHTSELQSLMRISYAVFRLNKKKPNQKHTPTKQPPIYSQTK